MTGETGKPWALPPPSLNSSRKFHTLKPEESRPSDRRHAGKHTLTHTRTHARTHTHTHTRTHTHTHSHTLTPPPPPPTTTTTTTNKQTKTNVRASARTVTSANTSRNNAPCQKPHSWIPKREITPAEIKVVKREITTTEIVFVQATLQHLLA